MKSYNIVTTYDVIMYFEAFLKGNYVNKPIQDNIVGVPYKNRHRVGACMEQFNQTYKDAHSWRYRLSKWDQIFRKLQITKFGTYAI